MSALSFSAPGKLYLLGEYAVLEGAPALLAAVDRRATVTLRESAAGWSLTSPQVLTERLLLGAKAALPRGIRDDLARKLRLFDEVRAGVNAVTAPTNTFDIEIDTAPFLRGGHKLGLGSSAAVAVALTAALAAGRGSSLTLDALFTLAASAHAAAQDGKGSGGDVAASVYGGLIHYTRGEAPRPMEWPKDLDMFVVVTGTGSNTVDLVLRVGAYAARDPAAYRKDVARLTELAGHTEEALGHSTTFLKLADDYFRGVEELDSHANAGIVTERHRELRSLAAKSGAVFKTSGAGGGDVGLVFAKLDATDQLRSVFTEAGAAVIPATYSTDGVRTELV